jgi:hypothetical protein
MLAALISGAKILAALNIIIIVVMAGTFARAGLLGNKVSEVGEVDGSGLVGVLKEK